MLGRVLGLAFAFATPALVHGTVMGPKNVLGTDVRHYGSATVANQGWFQLQASGIKEGYLRFEVTNLRARDVNWEFPHTRFGRVTSAQLTVYVSDPAGAPAGKTISVHPTDNYSGASFTPRAIAQTLATANIPTSAGSVTFNVTPYISGEGVFSFVLKSDYASAITLHGKTGATPPKLVIQYDDGFGNIAAVQYQAQDYVNRGKAYRARYSDQTLLEEEGIFDVTKQPYNAIPNDGIDDTLGLQRAVNEAQAARATVYLPTGTYVISDTLNIETPHIVQQELETFDNGPDSADGDIDGDNNFQGDDEAISRQDFPCILRGVHGGTAKIQLVGGSNFNDPAKPKPAIYFWSRDDVQARAHVNSQAINFNHSMYDVDVDISAADTTSHSGAIAISMAGSQGCRLSKMDIIATNAFAGLGGLPSAGAYTHAVSIDGGKYGVYVKPSGIFGEALAGYTPVLSMCTIKNQTSHGVYYGGGIGSLTLVGCRIYDNHGISLDEPAANPWNGAISVIDSHIRLKSGVTTPAIIGKRSVVLRNVWIDGSVAHSTVTLALSVSSGTGTATLPHATGRKTKVGTFAASVKIDQSPYHSGSGYGVAWVPIFNNGVNQASDTNPTWKPASGDVAPYSTDPATTVFTDHDWEPTPDFKLAYNVVKQLKNHATTPVRGDDLLDDTAGLQAAITANANVFLPGGTYYISSPLQLRPDSKLFGISKAHTVIKTIWNSFQTGDAGGNPEPLIRTAVDTAGDTLITDLQLRTRIVGLSDQKAYFLDWRVGHGTVKDVSFERRYCEYQKTDLNHPAVKISNPGGGKWYGFWINRDYAGPNYRHMLISGVTTNPLQFYMFNPEYGQVHPQVEVVNSDDIDFYGTKTEGNWLNFLFQGCQRFRLYGMGGNSSPMPESKDPANCQNILLVGCTNYLIANQLHQQRVPVGYDGAGVPFWHANNASAYDLFHGANTDPSTYFRVVERSTRSGTASASPFKTPGTEQFVLVRSGTP